MGLAAAHIAFSVRVIDTLKTNVNVNIKGSASNASHRSRTIDGRKPQIYYEVTVNFSYLI